eukprot:g1123.t1
MSALDTAEQCISGAQAGSNNNNIHVALASPKAVHSSSSYEENGGGDREPDSSHAAETQQEEKMAATAISTFRVHLPARSTIIIVGDTTTVKNKNTGIADMKEIGTSASGTGEPVWSHAAETQQEEKMAATAVITFRVHLPARSTIIIVGDTTTVKNKNTGIADMKEIGTSASGTGETQQDEKMAATAVITFRVTWRTDFKIIIVDASTTTNSKAGSNDGKENGASAAGGGDVGVPDSSHSAESQEQEEKMAATAIITFRVPGSNRSDAVIITDAFATKKNKAGIDEKENDTSTPASGDGGRDSHAAAEEQLQEEKMAATAVITFRVPSPAGSTIIIVGDTMASNQKIGIVDITEIGNSASGTGEPDSSHTAKKQEQQEEKMAATAVITFHVTWLTDSKIITVGDATTNNTKTGIDDDQTENGTTAFGGGNSVQESSHAAESQD